MSEDKIIQVDYLARVEGEGSLYVQIQDGRVVKTQLKIFEPPRFFEAFLQGRGYQEVPDITARICGICPVAYQMSSVHAMENILGLTMEGPLRELRRLLYCGEWIESHGLHIYMLHAPDFLGYESGIHLAKDHPQIVERGLKLKKIGNEIVRVVGGREIHPINVRVGGFYRTPSKKEILSLQEKLKWAIEAARDTVKWTATFSFPDFEQDYEFVSLRHPGEYPFNEGRIVSSGGLDISVPEYENHFEEIHQPHSHALHSLFKGKGNYLVGPMARFHLNFDRLTPLCQEICKEVGLSQDCKNPFKSILVRSVEMLYACEEALRIVESYTSPASPFMPYKICPGEGFSATEAPRGLLYHHYKIDPQGKIEKAKIVPPTSQNQGKIEEDLSSFVQKNLSLSEKDLTWKCEQIIRNYDPCISCATHFLKLTKEEIPPIH